MTETKAIKNKDYHFLVFKKWSLDDYDLEKKIFDKNKNNNEYYDEDDEDDIISIGDLPDPVRTEYEIQQQNLKRFADDNNFWDMYTLFPISKAFLGYLGAQKGVEIVSLPSTTPYRTRISIGKLFDSSKVMQSIIEKAEEYVNGNTELVTDIIYYRNTKVSEIMEN